jgi:cytochrome c biogenesis protein CcmG/thiol:disulfide interchange protein DsbE
MATPTPLTIMDLDGRVGIDYGVYGVPETYVIDKAGVIRMKHTGPITPEILARKSCRCWRS